MRAQKILRRVAIFFLVVCIIFLAIDVIKTLKINFDYMQMQSSKRISLSSNEPEIRYEPTDYKISNKEDMLEQVKEVVRDLKAEQSSDDIEGLVEIGNINKIEVFFYNYEQYTIVKYKLLNIMEDLPKLYKATKGYTNDQLKNYFENNSVHIDSYYGITSSDEFVELAKSLSFLGNNEISFAAVRTASIDFSYDLDTLTFNFRLDAGDNTAIYRVKAQYYKASDNQVTPYLSFKVN